MRQLLAALLVALVVPGAVLAIETWPITGASIAGAKLGWTRAQYDAKLGKPGRVDQLELGVTRLVYAKRKLEVYLHARRGVGIATWNRRHSDGAGIGPCAPLADARATYGTNWKKLTGGPSLALWHYRTLTFRVGKGKVLAVVLATKPYRLLVAGNTNDCA
jgi:hypothetical protein